MNPEPSSATVTGAPSPLLPQISVFGVDGNALSQVTGNQRFFVEIRVPRTDDNAYAPDDFIDVHLEDGDGGDDLTIGFKETKGDFHVYRGNPITLNDGAAGSDTSSWIFGLFETSAGDLSPLDYGDGTGITVDFGGSSEAVQAFTNARTQALYNIERTVDASEAFYTALYQRVQIKILTNQVTGSNEDQALINELTNARTGIPFKLEVIAAARSTLADDSGFLEAQKIQRGTAFVGALRSPRADGVWLSTRLRGALVISEAQVWDPILRYGAEAVLAGWNMFADATLVPQLWIVLSGQDPSGRVVSDGEWWLATTELVAEAVLARLGIHLESRFRVGRTGGRYQDVDFNSGKRLRDVQFQSPRRLRLRGDVDHTRAAPGTVIDTSQFGMSKSAVKAAQRVAEKHQVLIVTRPTSPNAIRLIEQGHHPKPEWNKCKTINEFDVILGADPNGLNRSGYFDPVMPNRPDSIGDEVWGAIQSRHKQRYEEFHFEQKAKMDQYVAEGKIRIENGVVINAKTGFGYTGDSDLWVITDLQGRPLSEAQARQVYEDLVGTSFDPQHPCHMWWKPEGATNQKIFDKIVDSHMRGGEGLIAIGPRSVGDPMVVYSNTRTWHPRGVRPQAPVITIGTSHTGRVQAGASGAKGAVSGESKDSDSGDESWWRSVTDEQIAEHERKADERAAAQEAAVQRVEHNRPTEAETDEAAFGPVGSGGSGWGGAAEETDDTAAGESELDDAVVDDSELYEAGANTSKVDDAIDLTGANEFGVHHQTGGHLVFTQIGSWPSDGSEPADASRSSHGDPLTIVIEPWTSEISSEEFRRVLERQFWVWESATVAGEPDSGVTGLTESDLQGFVEEMDEVLAPTEGQKSGPRGSFSSQDDLLFDPGYDVETANSGADLGGTVHLFKPQPMVTSDPRPIGKLGDGRFFIFRGATTQPGTVDGIDFTPFEAGGFVAPDNYGRLNVPLEIDDADAPELLHFGHLKATRRKAAVAAGAAGVVAVSGIFAFFVFVFDRDDDGPGLAAGLTDQTSTPTATSLAGSQGQATITATPSPTVPPVPGNPTATPTATPTVPPAPVESTGTPTPTVPPAPGEPTATPTVPPAPAEPTATPTTTPTVPPAPEPPTATPTITPTVPPAPPPPTATPTTTPSPVADPADPGLGIHVYSASWGSPTGGCGDRPFSDQLRVEMWPDGSANGFQFPHSSVGSWAFANGVFTVDLQLGGENPETYRLTTSDFGLTIDGQSTYEGPGGCVTTYQVHGERTQFQRPFP